MSEARPVRLPEPVRVRMDRPLAEFWGDRVRQHTGDLYADVPISKFPEDLRVYEHLLWADAPNVVIEIGAQFGGSSLWFRDRLETLAAYGRIERPPRVIAVELEVDRLRDTLRGAHPERLGGIDLVGGDVTDPGLAETVAALLAPGDRCMVIEDSAHVYETTIAALRGFARFVPAGGFFVVEDACVDVEEMRVEPSWPRGVLPALQEWLGTPEGSAFRVRPELELYGITCHPGGFLQRLDAPSAATPGSK